ALRNIVMYNKPNVRLIDAHSEGNSCHHHINIFHDEHILMFDPGLGIKSRMIWNCRNSVYLKRLREFLNPLSAKAVDDSRFSKILLNKSYDIAVNIFCLRPYFVIKVWPVKAGFKSIGICNPKVFQNILLNLWSCGGS